MPITIKNHQTKLLARKLAKLTGESLTDYHPPSHRRATNASASQNPDVP